jgi:hypothetical protein
MFKKIIITISIFIALFFLIKKYQDTVYLFSLSIKNYIPSIIDTTLRVVFNHEKYSKKINNDYNTVFLPETQFKELDFKKIKLNFITPNISGYNKRKKTRSFFIETNKNNLFMVSSNGKLFFSKLNDINNDKYNFEEKSYKINKKDSLLRVTDLNIYKDKIIISRVIKINKCHYLVLDQADITNKNFEFKEIFKSKTCEKAINAGKVEAISENKILLTTATSPTGNREEKDPDSQNDSSIFGKVLLINTDTLKYKVYSKGHRNSLGLLVDGDYILSTENGPKGGDEINLEIEGKNYGWDIASYGVNYKKTKIYLDHEKLKFKEPIFAFVPSIGISEIIKLGNNFAEEWQDNYLIGSLNYLQLLRVKLNEEKSKVLFIEKIFIGERIRDLVYDSENKIILLALENSGSLGILKAKN